MELNMIKPLSDRLLLHKCENAEPDGLVLPEKTRDNTLFCQVVSVGPKCRLPWTVGSTVRVVEDFGDGINEVPGSNGDFWLVREGKLDPAVYDG